MKTAIGGTLLFQLMMLFVVIYMGLMAMGINYAVTFRVKNQILTILQDKEIYEDASQNIEEYLSKINYYGGSKNTDLNKNGGSVCLNNTTNYCIEKKSLTTGGYYYVVTTYVIFDFPIVGKFMQSPVSGETSVLKDLTKIN